MTPEQLAYSEWVKTLIAANENPYPSGARSFTAGIMWERQRVERILGKEIIKRVTLGEIPQDLQDFLGMFKDGVTQP